MGIVPTNSVWLTVVPSDSEHWKYNWKRLFVCTVHANHHGTMTGRGYLWYCPCKFLSWNYDRKRLFVDTVPANFCHWPWNYEWKRLFGGIVPAIFSHWPWNCDWKRFFVGTVPANFCHWPWNYFLLEVIFIFLWGHFHFFGVVGRLHFCVKVVFIFWVRTSSSFLG